MDRVILTGTPTTGGSFYKGTYLAFIVIGKTYDNINRQEISKALQRTKFSIENGENKEHNMINVKVA
jgi:hypothetical protein